MTNNSINIQRLFFHSVFSVAVLLSLGILFSIVPSTKVALASGCPGNMDYSSWTNSQKLTVFSTLPISHGINLQSWTNPSGKSLNLGVIDWGNDMYCSPSPGPFSATSTITILPTNYSFTINTLQKQSASGYGSYAWSYYDPNDVTDNPLPDFNWPNFSASCSGWQCYITGYGDFINHATVGAQGNYDYNSGNIPPFVENNLGYSVTGNLPAISTITFSVDKTKRIQAEDSIINDIQASGHIHVKIDTPSIGNTYTASIPATNCYHISGNGPRKIIFVRGRSWDSNILQYMSDVNSIIYRFNSTDPFSVYSDQLSFYVDLHKIDETKLIADSYGKFSDNTYVKSASSCNGIDSISDDAFEYIFMTGWQDGGTGWTLSTNEEPGSGNVVYLSPPDIIAQSVARQDIGLTAMHESGHAVGDLEDEYTHNIGSDDVGEISPLTDLTNCALGTNGAGSPEALYRSSLNNVWYGSQGTAGTLGCEGHYYNTEGLKYHSPSFNSMMNDEYTLPKFNIISCGYIIAAILGEPVDKAHAQTHWPICWYRAVNEDSITGAEDLPPSNPNKPARPVIAANSSIAPGFFSSLTSSNLTAENNSTQFTNTATNQTYDVYGIPSTNGTSLSFTVPADAPPGNYTLQVGAFNSNWSDSIPITITAGHAPSPTPNVSQSPTATSQIPVTLLSLTQGSTGPNVVTLQNYLIQDGYLGASYNTGYYGSLTAAAVVRYKNAAVNYQSVSTPSPTPTPTSSPSPTPTATPYPTYSPYSTIYPTPTPTPSQTSIYSPTPTATPSPSPTPSPTPTPTPTYYPLPTSTPSPTSTPKPTPSASPTPSPTPTTSPTVKSSPTPSPSPTPTSSPSPKVTSSPSPTPSPSSSPQAMNSGGITSMSAAIWNAIKHYLNW